MPVTQRNIGRAAAAVRSEIRRILAIGGWSLLLW